MDPMGQLEHLNPHLFETATTRARKDAKYGGLPRRLPRSSQPKPQFVSLRIIGRTLVARIWHYLCSVHFLYHNAFAGQGDPRFCCPNYLAAFSTL